MMRYEKTMLILSGSGKGVVLIEKSGLGVKCALRTFGIGKREGLKAGIITPSDVFVRDLPHKADPDAVFFIDCDDIKDVHFAVFDSVLVLYGATGKRMWEANVMGLFQKRCEPKKRGSTLPSLPSLPKERVSSLTGGADTLVYGDDALAEGDFYTPFDISSRMKTVDGFLDGPRVLDGLSPQVSPRERAGDNCFDMPDGEAAACSPPSACIEPDSLSPQKAPEPKKVFSEPAANVPVIEQTVAPDRPPWLFAAEWLGKRSTRALSERQERVPPLQKEDSVKTLREASFLERSRADIERLFSSSRRDGELSKLLPELEWIKTPVDGRAISVGRGEGCLCYAVPGVYEKQSPLGDEAQWLPKLKTSPTGKGYWLIFQSLATGEIIKAGI